MNRIAFKIGILIGVVTSVISTCEISKAQVDFTNIFGINHYLDIHYNPGPIVAGDRVSLLLQAESVPVRLPDSARQSKNIRGYLLSAELTREGNIDDTRSIVGPLWSIPGPISSMVADPGVPFTKQDREDMSRMPYLNFNHKGQLLKLLPTDEPRKFEALLLDIHKDHALWKPAGLDRRFTSFWPSEYLESTSKKYVVRWDNDQVRIYDTWTGERISDAWLEASMADARSRDNIYTGYSFVTDDLHFLGFIPLGPFKLSWNKKPDPKGEWMNDDLIRTFEIDGKELSLEDHGLLYKRPTVKPELVAINKNEFGRYHPQALVLDNKLCFFDWNKEKLVLRDINGKSVIEQPLEGELAKLALGPIPYSTPRIAYDSQASRLIFIFIPRISKSDPTEKFYIGIWYFNEKRVQVFSTHIWDLFDKRDDGYYPKDAIPISDK